MSIFVKLIVTITLAVLFASSGAKADESEDFDLFGVAESTGVLFLERGTLEDVETVQEAFYERGFDITVDGNHGPKTEEAIRRLQLVLRQPATGILTQDQWQALKNMNAPASWGALSVSSDGKFGEAHGKKSRALAEQIALRRCQIYTKKECIVVSAGDYRWLLASWCQKGNTRVAFLQAAENKPVAFYELAKVVRKSGFDLNRNVQCFKIIEHNAMFGYDQDMNEAEADTVEYQNSLEN